jgi:predicted O-methyltransferase YrrM
MPRSYAGRDWKKLRRREREIVRSDVNRYLHELLPRRDAVLSEIEQLAKRRRIPIIGPAVARVLFLLARISGARRIFEMGSAVGYSTIWLARAAGPGSEIYYTDGDSENARRAKRYFQRAGVDRRIRILVGDALELIGRVRGSFDMIFIDVDKDQYPAALRRALPRLRRGGLLVVDNALWSGRVAHRAGRKDSFTRGVQAFNRAIYSSRALYPVILPLRDGVAICRKE